MEIDEGYAWSTHQPIINACLDYFKPAFICEIGTGIYSTPLFIKEDAEKLFIENDFEFKQYIEKKYGIDILFHAIPVANHTISPANVSKEVKNIIAQYYLSLNIPDKHPSLLFVDGFCATRAIAINALWNKFDIVIYHDAEAVEHNQYYFDFSCHKKTLVTPRTWTTVMSKLDLSKIDFTPYVKKYEMENNITGLYIQ